MSLIAFEPHLQAQIERCATDRACQTAQRRAVLDWMGTHRRVIGFWLDRLIEQGDDEDMVTLLHRQHAWLGLMEQRLSP